MSYRNSSVDFVLLDMHGVIVDEWDAWTRWSGRLCGNLGSENGRLSVDRIQRTVLDVVSSGSTTVTADVVSVLGVDIDLAWDAWDGITPDKLYDNARVAIQELANLYKLAIVANATSDCRDRLYDLGVGAYFEKMFLSAEIGVAKPDLEIWHIAMAALDCPAAHMVMVGDRVQYDLRPAASLGIRTVRVMSMPFSVERIDSFASVSIKDISQLASVLNKI